MRFGPSMSGSPAAIDGLGLDGLKLSVLRLWEANAASRADEAARAGHLEALGTGAPGDSVMQTIGANRQIEFPGRSPIEFYGPRLGG